MFAPTDLTRVLRIGCVDNAIFTYLSQSLPPLFEKAPRIGVEFRPILRNFIEQLSTGELDFAVYPTVPPSDVLHSAPLVEDVFVLACSKKHPLARLSEQRPLTAEDFKPYRQVRIATAPAKYDAWDEGGKNGLANSGGLRHDTTSFKESFHGHAPPPVHS